MNYIQSAGRLLELFQLRLSPDKTNDLSKHYRGKGALAKPKDQELCGTTGILTLTRNKRKRGKEKDLRIRRADNNRLY